MNKPWTKTNTVPQATHFVDFGKASPEALDQILTALNTEVDRAILQNRFPTLDGAFSRLSTPSGCLQ